MKQLFKNEDYQSLKISNTRQQLGSGSVDDWRKLKGYPGIWIERVDIFIIQKHNKHEIAESICLPIQIFPFWCVKKNS